MSQPIDAQQHNSSADIEQSPIDPPRHFMGIVRRLGPGMIIAGSIVGSGELIATTKTGAQAGMTLLWLIIAGCVIKVFVQIELGRHAITHGETTLTALDGVPGPRFGINWIIWCWLVMMAFIMAQLGGIVGGVGQSLALTFPVTGDYVDAVMVPSQKELVSFVGWDDVIQKSTEPFADLEPKERERILTAHGRIGTALTKAGEKGEQALAAAREKTGWNDPYTYDDKIWAALVTVATSALLFAGRYGLIQTISTFLVVMFTFITIGNVCALQSTEKWSITAADVWHGLSFQRPAMTSSGIDPLAMALAAFGIIGVGASELVAYPYWCLEKGYGKFIGPRDESTAWSTRAKGWMKIMLYDSFSSMVLYTIATIAFYLMGAVVLYQLGGDPSDMRMVSTLAMAYGPVFGEYATWLFLIGAIAVLYSTFLVANASNARMLADVLKVMKVIKPEQKELSRRAVQALSVALPMVSMIIYWFHPDPPKMVRVAGIMQGAMLPILGFAALFFRYRRTDARLTPRLIWDIALIVSCIGMMVSGLWGVYSEVKKITG
ncbi:MAG: transmembrane Mn(2+) transporter [Planctomycetota bacterium]|nr:transmembrane Mn(2+) transporter [Planctomycetota bacterium]MDA1213414.1 transmembrane Mn(2+) transporter [Planctomycetota bacterium]